MKASDKNRTYCGNKSAAADAQENGSVHKNPPETKDATGECPWSEERIEGSLKCDGTKSKGKQYFLWTEAAQLEAEEESERKRTLDCGRDEWPC